MNNQTDQANRPACTGHGEKLASRVGSGGDARSGASPDASTIKADKLERDAALLSELAIDVMLKGEGHEEAANVISLEAAKRRKEAAALRSNASVIPINVCSC